MLPHAKSYTSIYEIFGSSPFNDVLYKSPKKTDRERLFCSKTCGDSENRSDVKESINLNLTKYVTSENYHHLNKDVSYKSVVRSNSTIFYDLDEIAKRHSFHCLTELSISNANLLKVVKIPVTKNAFGDKSEAVVQECATQIQPKLLARDSIDINIKKVKKKFDHNTILSSEIFLRDEEYTNEYDKNQYYEKNISDKQQKFWSYAKYRTEYINPMSEGKKHKKKEKEKEKEKQVEDPCPCQLFSYVCPCNDKKSLTELARSHKSLTVIDQVTSTNFLVDDPKDIKKKLTKKQKRQKTKEEKPTSISPIDTIEELPYKNQSITDVSNNQDSPRLTETVDKDQANIKNKQKPYKKPRKIICPNCKEKVEIISTTEDEEILKCDSSTYGSKELSPTTAYACRSPPPKSYKSKTEEDGDVCYHEPRCELVPVCQILPCDDNYSNSKTIKSQPSTKTNTRVIRITKACRHHPPCTVVPSCQRANVLKNNCEYIPPCLHRPRCVNLPLCVPFSKSMHYEEVNKHLDEKENEECPHVPRCKYIPVCQHDSLVNNVNHQIHMVPQMQHACEFMNGYQTPAFLITPQTNCMPNSYSPCQVPSPNTCSYKSTKSCQYDCAENKCYTFNVPKESESNEMVVFIRDVGCQFRNKNYSARESGLQSKVSSGSIDYVDVKMDKYYTNIHTLRYEDKFTNPISGMELSITSGSVSSSVEMKTNSPSREHRVIRESLRSRQTGFSPDVAYVAAFHTHGEPTSTTGYITSGNIKEMSKCITPMYRECVNPSSVKSHRSFMNYKHRRLFINRRKRCKSSKNININRSKHIVYQQTIDNYV